MNDNLNTPSDTTEFRPVPVAASASDGWNEDHKVPTQLKLSDAELEQLLENKPVVYVTDADETDDETSGLADFGQDADLKPTVH